MQRHRMQIMGIVNVTPDSFYSSCRSLNPQEVALQAKLLQEEGADLIDIGGESTRPGASVVPLEEELSRVIPAVRACIQEGVLNISVDTYKPAVARAAIDAGARMINDISGGRDPKMRELIAKTGVDFVLMHMQGTPQTMQKNPEYPHGVVETVFSWFQEQIALCSASGISPQQILLDVGIGFGKKLADNLALLSSLPKFRKLGCRILLGISRKSFLGMLSGRAVEKRLTETIAMQTLLMAHPQIYAAIDMVRVHDVAEHVALRELINQLTQIDSPLVSGNLREAIL